MLSEFIGLLKREVMRSFRSFVIVLIMILQPIMWLIFFGSSLSGLPNQFLRNFFGVDNYIAYLLPGQLSVSMLFIGFFSSMSLIWDKRFGFLKKILITPAPKEVVSISKILGATIRGLFQVPIMILVSIPLGVKIPLDPIGILCWILGLFMLGVGFSSLFMIISISSSDWQVPQIVSNAINLPLMFTSTTLFPRTFFPEWMRVISEYNPISYAADLGRSVINGEPISSYINDLIFLIIFALIFLILNIVITKRYLQAE
ncbi:MAG: ABC transporter permease [Sulfolobaceae archaeon]